MPFALRRKKQNRISDDQKLAWDQRDREFILQKQNAVAVMGLFDAMPPEIRKAFDQSKFGHSPQTMSAICQLARTNGVATALYYLRNFEREAAALMNQALVTDLEEMKEKLERSFKTHV